MSISRGFTLIELLVVIAIIGMLSSVVLGALNGARGKSANAAVKSTMANMRSQIQLTYDDGPYGTPNVPVCSNPIVTKFRTAAAAAGGGAASGTANICTPGGGASQSTFVISIELKVPESNGDRFWCFDSTGAFRGHPNAIGVGFTCP